MKRLFLAAIAAVGIHALLLTVKVEWRKGEPLPPSPPVFLTLSYKTPEVRQTPPQTINELPRTPDPPAPTRPEARKQPPVPERKAFSPKKKPPVRVPRQKAAPETPPPPRTVETQTVPDERARAEAEIPLPQASAAKQPSTVRDFESLAARPNSGVEKAYAKEAVPLYLKNPPPEYPSVARRRGYEGTVVLEVLVDREGKVLDLDLFQSSGHNVLDQAAMEAVRGWLFEPARHGEEKVDMWVKVPLTFRLK